MHGPLPHPPGRTFITRRGDIGWAVAILFFVALVARAAAFGNPVVGYDEQFYLLVGDRMLHGALPYVDIFDRKPIGLFLLYAFARLLGGDGFLAYKLLALVFVLLTALGVFHLARRVAGQFGALVASAIFLIWHSYMGGEAGQAPVFYDLFMVAAAILIVHAIEQPGRLVARGCAAMLCVGLAMQIKYSVLFEGVFFGCTFIWLAVRQAMPPLRLAGAALLWIFVALAPTLAVFGVYAALGHGDAFFFANFQSVLAQGRSPLRTQLRDLLEIVAILSPLIILRMVGSLRSNAPDPGAPGVFIRCWFVASLAGLLIYFRFNSPHYAIPLLLPLCIWIAPVFDAPKRRPAVSLILAGMALVMAPLVLADQQRLRGGAREAGLIAAAARTDKGCIYVYAGYPALYMLTKSCLPSRWAFPGALNMRDEASAAAQGVDPAQEVRRILADRPPVIIDEALVDRSGNPVTHALVRQALARDYVLTARVASEAGRAQLVYRRRDEGRSFAVAASRGTPSPAKAGARHPADLLHRPGLLLSQEPEVGR
jgi:hypothetical protein